MSVCSLWLTVKGLWFKSKEHIFENCISQVTTERCFKIVELMKMVDGLIGANNVSTSQAFEPL